MAEAACGPSNALSQFKQHETVDRSLHQDRLSGRHLNRNPQNFRSANPNAALLDADFEAFQAGFTPPVLDHPVHNQLQHTHFPVQPQSYQPQYQSQQGPSWANDFQQLHISSPKASTSNWAQGFQEQIAQSAPRAQTSVQSPLAFQQQARYGLTGFQSSLAPQQYHNAAGMQSKGKQPAQAEQFDEAAFERAFDMAREDMMADVDQEQPMQEDSNLEAMIERVEAATQQEATNMLNDVAQEAEQERYWRPEDTIHSSDIEYQPLYREEIKPAEQEQERSIHDDDQLAATAQELLEKVSHDQSDKFKNSQFLSLMRKLRDREVRVEGDKMVETTTAHASTTSDADDTLNASTSNVSRPLEGFQPQQPVDTRPLDYGIPPNEQDHDTGRFVNPNDDGRDVVNLLDDPVAMAEVNESDPAAQDTQPEPLTEDMDSEFLMTSPFFNQEQDHS